jgi:hypothetical protein
VAPCGSCCSKKNHTASDPRRRHCLYSSLPCVTSLCQTPSRVALECATQGFHVRGFQLYAYLTSELVLRTSRRGMQYVGSEVLTAATVKNSMFWDVTPCTSILHQASWHHILLFMYNELCMMFTWDFSQYSALSGLLVISTGCHIVVLRMSHLKFQQVEWPPSCPLSASTHAPPHTCLEGSSECQ